MRLSLLNVSFGNTGIGTGTACSGCTVGNDMVDDVEGRWLNLDTCMFFSTSTGNSSHLGNHVHCARGRPS
jgi:hypothetical protein